MSLEARQTCRTGLLSLAGSCAAAGGKDVWISGVANVVSQYLNAGFVDELSIVLRLSDGVDKDRVSLKTVEAVHSPSVTHPRYAVTRKSAHSQL